MKTDEKLLRAFEAALTAKGEDPQTVAESVRDAKAFALFLGRRRLTKRRVRQYKERTEKNYTRANASRIAANADRIYAFCRSRRKSVSLWKKVRDGRLLFSVSFTENADLF